MVEKSDQYLRFGAFSRLLHGLIIISFYGLVLTGLPLSYSESAWAPYLYRLMGGIEGARIIHRLCAIITFGYAFLHLGHIFYLLVIRRQRGLFWGPDSLVPQPKDFKDFWQDLLWFLERRPRRPSFDRWTYWEKFDYWAIFWGVTIIGLSGLVLWFPSEALKYLPGWAINIALIVHGEEAILAAAFIFTIHLFHSHLRPEKFPADRVIFTGRLTYGELEAERPAQYQRLLTAGTLNPSAPPLSAFAERMLKNLWIPLVVMGVAVVVLMVWGSLGRIFS